MACWAYTSSESEFFAIFGERGVPIRSIVPMVPREEGCPLCYIVVGDQLEEELLGALALKLFEVWQPECSSIDQAREYILSGLPLKTTHFVGVGTDDCFMVPHGAALNMAMRMGEVGD